VSRIFDARLTYNKGSTFIHTIRFELNNDSLFFAVLKAYQQQFGYSTANTLDFKTVLEQVTGRSFTQVFDQWFYGEGFPVFTVRWNKYQDTLFIASVQTTSTTTTPLFITPIEFLVKRAEGDTLIRVMQNQPAYTFKIPMPGTITGLEIDPNDWILNQGTAQKDVTLTGLSDDLTQRTIALYPNPVHDQLYLTLPETRATVSILDVSGRKISEQTMTQSQLDVQHLPQGIYFVQVVAENLVQTLRFVKQ